MRRVARSQIAITRTIAKVNEWTEAESEMRQRWMAEIAVKAWPLTG